jgi:soluble lytic murein transglycosylase-like protein
MPKITSSKRLKILSLNLIGISVIYAWSFCYGRVHRPISEAEVVGTTVLYSESILEAARTYDIQPALIAAVIATESNFKPRAVSFAGAKGLMQINAPTQRYLRLRNAFDPRENILAGSRYLRELLDRFNGDLVHALAAYNAGPGAVAKHAGVPPYKETRAYVKKVLASFTKFKKAFASDPFMS